MLLRLSWMPSSRLLTLSRNCRTVNPCWSASRRLVHSQVDAPRAPHGPQALVVCPRYSVNRTKATCRVRYKLVIFLLFIHWRWDDRCVLFTVEGWACYNIGYICGINREASRRPPALSSRLRVRHLQPSIVASITAFIRYIDSLKLQTSILYYVGKCISNC